MNNVRREYTVRNDGIPLHQQTQMDMYRIIAGIPSNRTIESRTLTNRGGHKYTCPFIGPYALSRAMKATLAQENIGCSDGITIPESFFEKYDLIECIYNPKELEESFVTSDYWYTCREKVTDLVELPAEF